jgi:hypothetical protein
MDSRIPTAPPRSDAVVAETAPRPTPTPVRVSFSDVVAAGAGGIVRGAQLALHTLPGSPLMAVAVRGPSGGGAITIGGVGSTSLAEGPSGIGAPTGQTSGLGVSVGGVSIGAPTGTSSTGSDSVSSTLQQAQDSNLYYLQLQAQMNAQSTQYTALTNVMKTEYDTVKTAIGNIH